jgi:hypothetical protein
LHELESEVFSLYCQGVETEYHVFGKQPICYFPAPGLRKNSSDIEEGGVIQLCQLLYDSVEKSLEMDRDWVRAVI